MNKQLSQLNLYTPTNQVFMNEMFWVSSILQNRNETKKKNKND